jgi:hypothetical protein
MANPDSVSQNTQDSFSNYRLGVIRATQLNTTGNAVITIPLLNGGLTNSGSTASSGGVIVRRITVQNPSGDVSSANVAISVQSTGNVATANAVVANVVLTNLNAAGRYQDLTVASGYGANTTVSGNTTSCLYVNVNTASGNANTVDIVVWGDVVNF